MADPWDGFIPEETIEHYRRAGFSKQKVTPGSPALLVIDVQYLSSGERPLPLDEAVAYHPMSCGEEAWKAIGHIQRLIAAFREAGFPIIYPHCPQILFQAKHNSMPVDSINPRHLEIVAEVAPQQGDILLPKVGASAFFATPLVYYLNRLEADTVFVVGNTTSGCIRASVVDAFSNNFQCVVPHDAVYDRAPISHAVNLFDISHKYGPVVSTDEAIGLIEQWAPAGELAVAQ